MPTPRSSERKFEWLVHAPGAREPSRAERYASTVGGGLLAVYGITRKSLGGALISGLGALLIVRGVKGRAPISYRAAGLRVPWAPRVEALEIHESTTVLGRPAELYESWRRIEDLAGHLSHVRSIRDVGGGRYHWVVNGPRGTTTEWDAHMTWNDEQRRIAWRTIDESSLVHIGNITFSSAPGDRGAEAHIYLRYEAASGAFVSSMTAEYQEDLAEGVAGDLRRYKQLTECGEVATTEGQSVGRARAGRRGPRPIGWKREELPARIRPEVER